MADESDGMIFCRPIEKFSGKRHFWLAGALLW
jgi:hypothetical protein